MYTQLKCFLLVEVASLLCSAEQIGGFATNPPVPTQFPVHLLVTWACWDNALAKEHKYVLQDAVFPYISLIYHPLCWELSLDFSQTPVSGWKISALETKENVCNAIRLNAGEEKWTRSFWQHDKCIKQHIFKLFIVMKCYKDFTEEGKNMKGFLPFIFWLKIYWKDCMCHIFGSS